MDVKSADLQSHIAAINAVLNDVCQTASPRPLVLQNNLSIVASGLPFATQVTNDLGTIELALPLPVPEVQHPKYWVGLYENWKQVSRHRVEFVDCGLRLFVGARDEQLLQLIRLEWVAPLRDKYREPIYTGKNAGQPHWHIDQAALTGPSDYFRSMDILTRQANDMLGMEDFAEVVLQGDAQFSRPYDCSWLNKVHLPAHAQWMTSKWDGQQVPGPHQCEPDNLQEIEFWWTGALRYLVSELPR